MKNLFLLLVILMFAASFAIGADYQFLREIQVENNEAAAAVALSGTGDLYYGTFNSATSHLVLVENAADVAATVVFTPISTESLPATRGINEIELDASGNIYVSATGSSGADTILKKFGPKPTFTLAWDMGSMGTSDQVRINGIELVNATTLACGKAFDGIVWKNTSDGLNTGTAVTGGDTYIRSLTLNTTNNDIYASKNGNYVLSALQIFTGGSPSNLAGYARAGSVTFFPNYGIDTQYGTATQATEYDSNNNQFFIADVTTPNDVPAGLSINTISGSGASTVFTEIQKISQRDGADTTGYKNIVSITYNKISIGGELRDVVAIGGSRDNGSGGTINIIDIYARPGAAVVTPTPTPPPLSVGKTWNIYQ